jgi:CheY-like chemotaxis protein
VVLMPRPAHTSGATETEPTPTVLVVDDDVLIRMVIADYLRECGFRVVEAANADEAVAVLEATPVDAVFSDVHMPGSMNGFGLAALVRQRYPGVAVTLTSGITRKADAAGELCMDGPLLAKPYEPAEVERRIRALLANRRGPVSGGSNG